MEKEYTLFIYIYYRLCNNTKLVKNQQTYPLINPRRTNK